MQDDIDLEDLEERLYSQVFHGQPDESDEINSEINLARPVSDMRRPGRYFGPWNLTPKYQNVSNNSHRQTNSRTPKYSEDQKTNNVPVNYEKQNTPPYNKNVVVVSTCDVLMTPKEMKRAKWKEKMKEWRKEKKISRRERKALRRAARKQENMQDQAVITLSDSEGDDSCILIDNNWPTLSVVDSDDENKNSKDDEVIIPKKEKRDPEILNENLSDDVILVEPVNAPVEIINLDEDADVQQSKTKNVETASSSSSDNIVLSKSPNKSAKKIQKERKELLSTPDSTSNDFMNNSGIELNKTNFNFSLHGSDFNDGNFLKPAARNEICETESSSSTAEVHSGNLIQATVFNEVDFPKEDIFSESNLESFGNFITPLRKSVQVAEIHSSPVRILDNQTQPQLPDSSDTSSESELEETQSSTKQKHLPELSPMTTNVISKDHGNLSVTKKAKKASGMSSKYDLLNERQPDSPVSDAKQKKPKSKKSRKKKSSASISSVGNSEENSVDEPLQTEDVKPRKRKSTQMDDDNNEKKKKEIHEKIVEYEVKDQKPSLETKPVTEPSNVKEEKNEAANVANEDKKTSLVPPEKVKSETSFQGTTSSPLEDLIIVDETFADNVVLSSDSESALSSLHGQQDITLNCENSETDLSKPSNFDPKNFSVKDLQMTMSNDPNLWDILDSDRTPIYRSKGRRCNRCKQYGHMAIRCPNKTEAKCSLCGRSGHYEPRCPNKICTQCGQRSPYSTNYCSGCFKYRNYVCPICSMTGHPASACPDLWRRYYLTTKEGPLVTNDSSALVEKRKLWCSGCAQAGHLEHSCRFYKSIYPASDPFIKSYEDIYKNKTRRDEEARPEPEQPPHTSTRVNYNKQNNNFDLRHLIQGRYNQNNNFGQTNQQYVNPWMDNVFVANQQNFYTSLPNNVVQIPQNNYYNNVNVNPKAFENSLPTYISFEEPSETYEDVSNFKPGQKARRNNALFFSSSGEELQRFIVDELHRLNKLSLLSNKIVKELRKRQIPRRDSREKEEYFEKLNMVLFGIYNLLDGKTHLNRLKRYERKRANPKVNATNRRVLHESYCYIFGRDRHYGVDYNELLRKL